MNPSETTPRASALNIQGSVDLPGRAGRQYRTLLAVSEAIVSHRDLDTLFHDLADQLHQVVRFDYLALALHDAASDTTRLHGLEASEPGPSQWFLEPGNSPHPDPSLQRPGSPFVGGPGASWASAFWASPGRRKSCGFFRRKARTPSAMNE
jgi:hypothetical protein